MIMLTTVLRTVPSAATAARVWTHQWILCEAAIDVMGYQPSTDNDGVVISTPTVAATAAATTPSVLLTALTVPVALHGPMRVMSARSSDPVTLALPEDTTSTSSGD